MDFIGLLRVIISSIYNMLVSFRFNFNTFSFNLLEFFLATMIISIAIYFVKRLIN